MLAAEQFEFGPYIDHTDDLIEPFRFNVFKFESLAGRSFLDLSSPVQQLANCKTAD